MPTKLFFLTHQNHQRKIPTQCDRILTHFMSKLRQNISTCLTLTPPLAPLKIPLLPSLGPALCYCNFRGKDHCNFPCVNQTPSLLLWSMHTKGKSLKCQGVQLILRFWWTKHNLQGKDEPFLRPQNGENHLNPKLELKKSTFVTS